MINIENLLDKHETAIEILWAIRYFQSQKQHSIESSRSLHSPIWYRNKMHDKADLYARCINRLKSRYAKVMGAEL